MQSMDKEDLSEFGKDDEMKSNTTEAKTKASTQKKGKKSTHE